MLASSLFHPSKRLGGLTIFLREKFMIVRTQYSRLNLRSRFTRSFKTPWTKSRKTKRRLLRSTLVTTSGMSWSSQSLSIQPKSLSPRLTRVPNSALKIHWATLSSLAATSWLKSKARKQAPPTSRLRPERISQVWAMTHSSMMTTSTHKTTTAL